MLSDLLQQFTKSQLRSYSPIRTNYVCIIKETAVLMCAIYRKRNICAVFTPARQFYYLLFVQVCVCVRGFTAQPAK